MWIRKVTIALAISLLGLSSALAGTNDYYFVDGLGNSQPLYVSANSCYEHVTTQSCVDSGAVCEGYSLYCSESICGLFLTAYNSGYQVDVRRHGTGEIACTYRK